MSVYAVSNVEFMNAMRAIVRDEIRRQKEANSAHDEAHKCAKSAPDATDTGQHRPAAAETPSWREATVERLDRMASPSPEGTTVGGIDRNPNPIWRNKPTDTTD